MSALYIAWWRAEMLDNDFLDPGLDAEYDDMAWGLNALGILALAILLLVFWIAL